MAATLRDLQAIIAAKEEERKRPKKPVRKNTKLAFDILHHYKFPGDKKSKKAK